jgi:hypothetical protein
MRRPLAGEVSRMAAAAANWGNRIFATGLMPPDFSGSSLTSLTGTFLEPGLMVHLQIARGGGCGIDRSSLPVKRRLDNAGFKSFKLASAYPRPLKYQGHCQCRIVIKGAGSCTIEVTISVLNDSAKAPSKEMTVPRMILPPKTSCSGLSRRLK